MSLTRRLRATLFAARELGPGPLGQYALYRFGLLTGHYLRATPPKPYEAYLPAGYVSKPFPSILSLPSQSELASLPGMQSQPLLDEANEIVKGWVRLFGGNPVPLLLEPPGPMQHWTKCLDDTLTGDVKLIWEPARLGISFPLGRAYLLTGDERYPRAFWQQVELFLDRNPPNLGPNWASAQEVGLRILAFAFAGQVFAGSPHTTPERMRLLSAAVAAHAARIPATLPYARAQNNNHLLTEALGLYLASALLPDHPDSARWQALGWRWLNHGLQTQIAPDGGYAQHSANYHRLMLHVALFGLAAVRSNGQTLPQESLERLSAATLWLRDLQDPRSGRVPNLGHNDGAHILPLSNSDFGDYRPVVQAASRAFLGAPSLPPGHWDELSAWLGLPLDARSEISGLRHAAQTSYAIHRLAAKKSWAQLRALKFEVRPAHADQMHVDLWWQGQAVLLDAGTYRYTAPPPWQNALTCAAVHNTLTVDNQEPMERAGKFLWLRWDQARLLHEDANCIEAEHAGYTRLGVLHRRALQRLDDDAWKIVDSLLATDDNSSASPHTSTLHYLLPDLPWRIDGASLILQARTGPIRLQVTVDQPAQIDSVQLVRGGESLYGPPNGPAFLGWYSPTYNHKLPALSFRVAIHGSLPLIVTTKIDLTP